MNLKYKIGGVNVKLIRSERFNNISCNFYNINEEIYMTGRQLGEAVGYLEPSKAKNNIVYRYKHLKSPEFSGYIKLRTSSGTQNTRIFNEDVINKVTSRQAKQIKLSIKSRVIELLGATDSERYINGSRIFFCAIYSDIKRRLDVPGYMDILRKDYAIAIKYIQNWSPEASLMTMI